MRIEDIRKAKADQSGIKNLAKYKLCALDLDLHIESICTELAHKYFKVNNSFCVFVDKFSVSLQNNIFSESFENQLEKLFLEKSNEFTLIESIEYYGIDKIVFNKNEDITAENIQ